MISDITSWILSTMQMHGAVTVFIGVIIESVIVPIPSPLIIMGAGAILIDPSLGISGAIAPILLKIVLPGAVASTLGAYFIYYLTFLGGKPVIDRYGRFLGFNWDDVLQLDKRMAGRVSLMIFLLRALPIMPLSLISGAAGVLRLPAVQFGIWTFLGSIPRCLILGFLGFLSRDTYLNLANDFSRLESVLSALIVISVVGLILWLRARMQRQ